MAKYSREQRDRAVDLYIKYERCTVGSRASATAAPPGPRTTARPGGTSRSGRGGATGGWRWRWTFQNKRHRHSHEGRRDTGQRRPLPDISAIQDTGRSPLHLLLDDRTSRSRAVPAPRAAAWFMAPTVGPSARGALPCLADGWWRPPRRGVLFHL